MVQAGERESFRHLTSVQGVGVRALSGEKQMPLIAIDGPQLYSKWLGESEEGVRQVFRIARQVAQRLGHVDRAEPGDAGALPDGGHHRQDQQHR